MTLDDASEKKAFKAGFLQYCQQHGISPEALIKSAELPVNPTSTWGGYLTDTNNGLFKDVGDYFTHFIPQNTMPWTEAWKTAPERYKNLPVDRVIGQAATASGGLGLAAGGTAAAITAGVPAALAAGGRAALGYGRAGASALARLLGLGRTTVPPVPPPVPAAGAAAPGMLGTLLRWGPVAAIAGGASRLGGGAATAAGSNLGNLGLLALGAPIAGGLALGGGLGWGAAKLTDPKITDDDLKADELEQAYRIQAKRLKARRDYEQYRSARGLDS